MTFEEAMQRVKAGEKGVMVWPSADFWQGCLIAGEGEADPQTMIRGVATAQEALERLVELAEERAARDGRAF